MKYGFSAMGIFFFGLNFYHNHRCDVLFVKNSFIAFAEDDRKINHQETIVSKIKKLADKGDPKAEYDLGILLLSGNLEEGIEYLNKSSDHGNIDALYMLGMMHVNGEYVKKEVTKGLSYLERASNLGSILATRTLGKLYYNNPDVNYDSKKAFEYFEKCAEMKDNESMFILGYLYLNGRGVFADSEKAFTWFKKSADNGNAKGAYNTSMAYQYGSGTNKEPNQAYNYMLMASNGGYADATAQIGLFYLNGYESIVKTDAQKGFEILQQVANESIFAQKALGSIYLGYKNIFPADLKKAEQMFSFCAKYDNDCRSELATMIIKGQVSNPKYNDLKLAYNLLSKASSEDNIQATVNLAIVQHLGLGVEKDQIKSFQNFTKAAQMGDSVAQYFLAICYFDGFGVHPNWTTGKYWLDRSNSLNYKPSIKLLNQLDVNQTFFEISEKEYLESLYQNKFSE